MLKPSIIDAVIHRNQSYTMYLYFLTESLHTSAVLLLNVFSYWCFIVLSLLENILAADTSASNNETAVEVTHQAVCCAGSWLQLGVPLPDCEKLADRLVASVFASASSPQLHQIG
jgi:hypothetical protein